MSNVTAVVAKDDWDGKDGSKNVLVIKVDGQVTHVFPVEHPVAVIYLREVEKNAKLLERLRAIAAINESEWPEC